MTSQTTCVWAITPELILAIDDTLGPPVDSYVNGSQTWFTDEVALGGITLEWRLHPAAGFRPIQGLATDDRWETTVRALDSGTDADALALGNETRSLLSLWDGLECFVAYDDDCEPVPLAQTAGARIGIPPTASGIVDHDVIGDAWERTQGKISVTELLMRALDAR
ncbi:MAG: hypothetical protein ACOYN3_07100 [Acidimicrobiia bacterium]